MSAGREYEITELGVFTPKRVVCKTLRTGEVGFVVAGIKEIDGAPVGDTFTGARRPAAEPLAGFKEIKPNVFAGLYPSDSNDYEAFREALAKLRLNDSALRYEPETSQALGFGFRCGFLGLLHMEIVQERLEREYKLALITTAPTVVYEVATTSGEVLRIENPAKLPPQNEIAEIREPIIQVDILVPQAYLGNVITLCVDRRGSQTKLHYGRRQVAVSYELPMSEMVLDFFDRLKSLTRGYASLDYSFLRFQRASLVKLDILINGEQVDALSAIVHQNQARRRGRELPEKMRN